MDLSKADKKVAKALIDKGVLIEFGQGLDAARQILNTWSKQGMDNREAYHALFKHIQKFDKHIACTYDGLGGSRYFDTVVYLLLNYIIKEEDLLEFSEETRKEIYRIQSMYIK